MAKKATITGLLMGQAYDTLILAIEAKKSNEIQREVQFSLNTHLLLGIAVEGVINELSEALLDKWTYKELEKATTPLKWKIISSLKPNGFSPDKEPLQTIIRLQKIRNEIVHPKSKQQNNDIIIASKETLAKNPTDDYFLPKEDFEIYIGFGSLHEKYNAKDSLQNFKKTIVAVEMLKNLFEANQIFTWVDLYQRQILELPSD